MIARPGPNNRCLCFVRPILYTVTEEWSSVRAIVRRRDLQCVVLMHVFESQHTQVVLLFVSFCNEGSFHFLVFRNFCRIMSVGLFYPRKNRNLFL